MENTIKHTPELDIEIISKEEKYFRDCLENIKRLLFEGEQNLILNELILKTLEKKIKEFKN